MLRSMQNLFKVQSRLLSTTASPTLKTVSNNSQQMRIQQMVMKDVAENNPVPVFKRALLYDKTIAIKDQNGEFSYLDIFLGSKKLMSRISDACGNNYTKEWCLKTDFQAIITGFIKQAPENRPVTPESHSSGWFGKQSSCRVAFLCPNDVTYILTQWAIWMSGQIAVPLSANYPSELIEYFINDSQSTVLVTTPEFESKLKPVAEKLKKALIIIEHQQLVEQENVPFNERSLISDIPDGSFYKQNPALILYTSGSTGKPKGVLYDHSNLEAQTQILSSAWNIASSDTILHSLPLNHVHGLVNGLLTPLSVGGKIMMLPKFDTRESWNYLLNIRLPQKDRITLYMGVPTTYNFLIQDYDKLFRKNSQMSDYIKVHCSKKIRLMISGSAPLPKTVFQRWKEITGHSLLERYGMTEIGMALSNTLIEDGKRMRYPGYVGLPLPNVHIRITNPENSQDVLLEAHGELLSNERVINPGSIKVASGVQSNQEIIGNLQVKKGPMMFKEYWNKPTETQREFTDDAKWFITGDSVCFDPFVGCFKILGRNSCDIIKTKGYKVSALEIETKLLECALIEDCAVIGVSDPVTGQNIVALVKCQSISENQEIELFESTIKSIALFCKKTFASYSIPTIIITDKIPRNQMGKVNKATLVKDYELNLSSIE